MTESFTIPTNDGEVTYDGFMEPLIRSLVMADPIQVATPLSEALEATAIAGDFKPHESDHAPDLRPLIKRVLDRDRLGHAGRNQRCPCGSGKKFKRCCISVRR